MTQLLTQGRVILAAGPITVTDDEIRAPDIIFPRHVLGAWEIVESELPPGFSPAAYEWDGTALTARPLDAAVAVPESISPRQFRQALNHFGFRQRVDSAVAASNDQDLKDWYEYTSEFQRHHPKVLTMAAALSFNDDQLDQVWIYGGSLM